MHLHVHAQRSEKPAPANRRTGNSTVPADGRFISLLSQFRRTFLFSIGLILLSPGTLFAQSAVEWDKVVGKRYAVAANTPDGGFMLGGTSSFDYAIAKFNASGIKQWEKIYVGNNNDQLTAIIPTSDGGYLLGGNSSSMPVSTNQRMRTGVREMISGLSKFRQMEQSNGIKRMEEPGMRHLHP